MTRREPMLKRLEGVWPIIVGAIVGLAWLVNQAVSYRQSLNLISNQEKRLDEDEKANTQKHMEQDRNYLEQTVQNQNIQQKLGEISQQVTRKR